jgi:hypothetical protein
MYTIVIILTFLCPDGSTIDSEKTFPTKQYGEAVAALDEYLEMKGLHTKYFGGQKCVLDQVKPGHRKVK